MHHFGGLDEGTLNPEIVQGLVHVLDKHNSLVRLFRTAKERCRAGDVSGFKIKLYNIGGVPGHELLTLGVLGGIVFEDGPKSRTNFDVIIEFRGGPLQRINKLHQSYIAGDMPGFKIRLYCMGGVCEYELLTSGLLGGIVFEDGPKSRTDFDVIIEFRVLPRIKIETSRWEGNRKKEETVREYKLAQKSCYQILLLGDLVKDDIDCYPHPSTGGTTWLHNLRHVNKDGVSVSRTPRNPHDPQRYTCSSSSGSADIVASGICHAVLGSDAGGCISTH
nr:helitron helicase-like domain-containing protein [Tanacetum cinerariifolium]